MLVDSTKSGPQWTTRLSGNLDHKSLRDFQRATLGALSDPEVKTISVDMGNLTYLDSSGLGALLILREKAQSLKKAVELIAARGDVKKALEISNFNKLFVCR
jgi:HptB-dependent secretion and biofilm anti anti-sigma factor